MSVKSGTAYLFAAMLALSPSLAFAASPQPTPSAPPPKTALAPGGAAGLRAAEMSNPNTAVWIAGAAIVVGGLALVLSGNGNGHGTMTTSTSGTN